VRPGVEERARDARAGATMEEDNWSARPLAVLDVGQDPPIPQLDPTGWDLTSHVFLSFVSDP
jgi:hypothetical protein